MYDSFSSDYDRFVNWDQRLAYEMPFIESQLQAIGVTQPVRVLDAACGTGMHTIALAQKGYEAAGADLSAGMIDRAKVNAVERDVSIPFYATGFGDLAATFKKEAVFPFHAVLCLGNSLPHILPLDEMMTALEDFTRCLLPGGMLLIQNRNFDAVLANRERWMEPQSHRQGNREWLFLRFYDYLEDRMIDFNILRLFREGEENWQQQVTTTHLRPLTQDELVSALTTVGFSTIFSYGDMTGSPFDREKSGNLVITARW